MTKYKHTVKIISILMSIALISTMTSSTVMADDNTLKIKLPSSSVEFDDICATKLMGLSWCAYNPGITSTETIPENYIASTAQSVATDEDIKKTDIYKAYEEADMTNIKLYNYYDNPNDSRYGDDNCAFTLGYSKANGVNMLLVTIRGSVGGIDNLSSDWKSNFNFQQTDGYHTGFLTASKKVQVAINDYIVDNKLSNVTYIITGHSRGAAIANITAAQLIDNGTPIEKMYCYTFACPDVTTKWQNSKNYPCIFNICNTKDIVTLMPRISSYAYDARIDANYSNGINLLAIMLDASKNINSKLRWSKNGTTLWFSKASGHTGDTKIMGYSLPSYIDIYSHAQYVYFNQTSHIADMLNYEQEGDVCVVVNGYPLTFDQVPVIVNDRTLVPLRKIFEALGADVTWDDATQTAIATKDNVTIKITIDSNVLYKNDAQTELDVSAQLINDRTMVPVRAISEAFNCNVDWDDDTQTVIINK